MLMIREIGVTIVRFALTALVYIAAAAIMLYFAGSLKEYVEPDALVEETINESVEDMDDDDIFDEWLRIVGRYYQIAIGVSALALIAWNLIYMKKGLSGRMKFEVPVFILFALAIFFAVYIYNANFIAGLADVSEYSVFSPDKRAYYLVPLIAPLAFIVSGVLFSPDYMDSSLFLKIHQLFFRRSSS
jgi:hypothetical protein